ncbi:hypothetical protein pb186bvf_016259 [Paramecium bursaria]
MKINYKKITKQFKFPTIRNMCVHKVQPFFLGCFILNLYQQNNEKYQYKSDLFVSRRYFFYYFHSKLRMFHQYSCTIYNHNDSPIIRICQNTQCQQIRRVCEKCQDQHIKQCKREYIYSEDGLQDILAYFKQTKLKYLEEKKRVCSIQKYLMIQGFLEFIKYWEEEYKKWDYFESVLQSVRNDLNYLTLEAYIRDSNQNNLNNLEKYLEKLLENKISEIDIILQDKQNLRISELIQIQNINFIDIQKEVLNKINRQLDQQINMSPYEMFQFMRSQYKNKEQIVAFYEKFNHYFLIYADKEFQQLGSQINFHNISIDKHFQIQICRKGNLMLSLGRFNQSLKFFEQVRKLYTSNFNAYSAKSCILEHQKDYEGAIECMKKFIQFQPDHSEAHFKIGYRKFDEAINQFDLLIKSDATHFDAYYQIDNNFIQYSQYWKSIECLNLLIKTFNHYCYEFVYAYEKKANIYIKMSSFDMAIDCFDKLLQYDPKNFTYYLEKANIYIKLSQLDKAIDCMDQLLQNDPKNCIANEKKAEIYVKQSLLDQAIDCWNKLIYYQPFYLYVYWDIGYYSQIYILQSKHQKVIECWDLYINDCLITNKYDYKPCPFFTSYLPSVQKGFFALAYWHMNKVNFQKAEELCDEQISKDPSNYQSYQLKALILIKQGKNQEAIVCLDQLTEINTNKQEAYILKAKIYEELQNYEEAIKTWNFIIQQYDLQQFNQIVEELQEKQFQVSIFNRIEQN